MVIFTTEDVHGDTLNCKGCLKILVAATWSV